MTSTVELSLGALGWRIHSYRTFTNDNLNYTNHADAAWHAAPNSWFRPTLKLIHGILAIMAVNFEHLDIR